MIQIFKFERQQPNIKTNELEYEAMNYNPQHKIYSNRERYELHLENHHHIQTALDSKVMFISFI